MADILFTIDKYVVLVNFIAFLMIAPHSRQALSCFVSVAFLLLANTIMFWCEIKLKTFYVSEPDFVKHIWFFVFGFLDLICIMFIYRFHTMFGISPSRTSKSVIQSFNMLVIVQAIAHFDRFIFQTEYILEYYSYAIPAINIGIATATLYAATKLNLFSYSNKRVETEKTTGVN